MRRATRGIPREQGGVTAGHPALPRKNEEAAPGVSSRDGLLSALGRGPGGYGLTVSSPSCVALKERPLLPPAPSLSQYVQFRPLSKLNRYV